MLVESSFVVSERHMELLKQLSGELPRPGLWWASGYLAGQAAAGASANEVVLGGGGSAAGSAAVAAPVSVEQKSLQITVLYGSQTGNAKRVAEQLTQQLQQRLEQQSAQNAVEHKVRLVRTSEFKVRDLKKEELLYFVISTHSSGDEATPPDDSQGFFDDLMSKRAPKLEGLEFAVLALGDSSYPDFCGVGRKIDERFVALGAKRVLPIAEADVDIETVSEPWLEQVESDVQGRLNQVGQDSQGNQAAEQNAQSAQADQQALNAKPTSNKPFNAEVLLNQRIVASDLDKDVRHIELSLEDSGLSYQPGDALGVWPTQHADLVDAVLKELALDGETPVTIKGEEQTLRHWLAHRRELTLLTRPFIQAHLAHLEQLPEAAEINRLLNRVQLIDFLRQYPRPDFWTAQTIVEALRPLAARMYSISSSQSVVDEEVHITLGAVKYQLGEQDERWGAASRFLCDLQEGETVPVFVEANDRFALPAQQERDIIMIGPGTGVAPFRAFLQERIESGATGRNWLIFGNWHLRSDFLYQTEWRQALASGALTRLDVAFSRDQEEKIYVQDRLREHANELWNWLEGGAHLYVCGDAGRMASDVHQTLLDVAQSAGGKTEEQAKAWLQDLLQQGRYARDVY